MLIDMHDPASIAAWVRIAPARHWPQLKAMVRVHPQWREAAKKAQALLKSFPQLT